MRTSRFQQSHPPEAAKPRRESGFTIVEILIAGTILIVGMSALGALVATSLSGTDAARYMSTATTLASEKLEDLNRWPSVDPDVAAGGSLTADTAVGSIDYYDDVAVSNTNGYVSETVASTTSGTTTYSGVIHNATGYVNTSISSATPTGSGVFTFHRRWLIEANPVVNGVTLTGSRRITVLVTLSNSIVQQGVSFKMSLIRP